VVTPFATTLDPSDRSFGDVPADVHIDGFTPLHLRLPRDNGHGQTPIPCEVSIVRIGPRKEKEGELDVPTTRTFLVLTSRGKMLWKEKVAETPSSAFADHYKLSRVVRQFEKAPFVLLLGDSGGNTRNFSYDLYRVTLSGLEKVWTGDWYDGHSGSVQQGYSWSNFDFSKPRSGRANQFTVYTTFGCRRWMLPGDEEFLKPKYTKRVYRWDAGRGTFVKIAERFFKVVKPEGRLARHL